MSENPVYRCLFCQRYYESQVVMPDTGFIGWVCKECVGYIPEDTSEAVFKPRLSALLNQSDPFVNAGDIDK